MIDLLSTTYPISVICEVVALPRSSYYYCAAQRDETSLKATIEGVAAQFPTYGSRRLSAQVKRVAPDLKPLGRGARAARDARTGLDGAPQKTSETND